jgi:NADH:ubiquinone oxidoreductase subunit 3 (subunit A)
MNLKLISIAAMVLCSVQMFVVWLITKSNRGIFEKYKAYEYGLALRELQRQKPQAAFIITTCYVLTALELILVVLAKFILLQIW